MRALLVVFFLCSVAVMASAQTSPIGKWKTIDDESGEPKSIIEITERGGKLFGKIVKLFRKANEDQDPVCEDCEQNDPRYKKKIIGMEILEGLRKEGDGYEGGSILDPANGKVYRCKIWLEGEILKVRGYWGPFFRTQSWHKAE